MLKTKDMSARNIVLFLISIVAAIWMYSRSPESIGLASPAVISFIRAAFLMFAAYLLFEKLFDMQLHTKIVLGMVLGGIAGIVWGAEIAEIKPIGTAFIRGIMMIVVPLVLASLIVGTASLGDIAKMKRIGSKTLIYYLASTAVAITIGLVLANLLQPGSGMDEALKAKLLDSYSGAASSKLDAAQNSASTVETFLNMIPTNPFHSLSAVNQRPITALTSANMLQIIFFAIIMGIALTMIPKEKARPVIDFFDGLNDVMIKIVLLVIELAPYGVLALIADAVGSFGAEILVSLLKYTLVTAFGLIIMIFLYPFVVSFFTGIKPFKFLEGIRLAQLTAFSTSSSGATLPVTMEVTEKELGVSNEIASFVLPLGATVNMDGTALYQGVAAVFIAQVYGIDLDLVAQLTIILTATLASIGTAAAPGVGILMLVIVLQQVGIPLEGIALILAVDRILDMIRTTVNVTSDATASVIIANSEGQLSDIAK